MSGPVASNSLLMNLGMRYPTVGIAAIVTALAFTVSTPQQVVTVELPTLTKHIAG